MSTDIKEGDRISYCTAVIIFTIASLGVLATAITTVWLLSTPPTVVNPSMCVVSSTSATLIPAEHNSITVLIKGNKEVCYVYRKPVATE